MLKLLKSKGNVASYLASEEEAGLLWNSFLSKLLYLPVMSGGFLSRVLVFFVDLHTSDSGIQSFALLISMLV